MDVLKSALLILAFIPSIRILLYLFYSEPETLVRLNELKSRYELKFVKSILSGISQAPQVKRDDDDDEYGNTPLKTMQNCIGPYKIQCPH